MSTVPQRTTLNALDLRFIAEYLKDLNGTQAWLRAGGGGKIEHAGSRAYQYLGRPEIQEAITAAQAERAKRVIIESDEVLRRVLGAATCDPNDIVQIRRGCCEWCHGKDFQRQYRTQLALDVSRRAFLATDEALVSEFAHGGVGYNPKLDPHPECPECGGDGYAYVHVNDTRNLSPEAKSLFAGAKQTKDGIEVKLHPQDKARELLMRHLGLLNDKLELTGDLADKILRARKRAGGR